MGALFLKHHYEPYQTGQAGKVYIPAETWGKWHSCSLFFLGSVTDTLPANHHNIFQVVGFETATLPWYDPQTHLLDEEGLLAAIETLPPRSIIVLQTAGNNPTGCDPNITAWHRLAEAFSAGKHFAFLDVAYPGFVTGNFEADCAPIRIFAEAGIPLLAAGTFGKSFGLYGERVGLLAIPAPSQEITSRIEGQMKLLARAETGAQPAFGAAIVQTILADQNLRGLWEQDLRHMAEQLEKRRRCLVDELQKLQTPGRWDFINSQAGMFWYVFI